MLQEGADILDIGGESTRPGAARVSESEELDRVAVAVQAVSERFDTVISVDTSNPRVMSESAHLGAGLLNDVRGFTRDGALEVAAASGLAMCVMHMQGQPDTMQANPAYVDVVADINGYFEERLQALSLAGVAMERVVLDPGFGFGKTAEHNFVMLARLRGCVSRPAALVGLSRSRRTIDRSRRKDCCQCGTRHHGGRARCAYREGARCRRDHRCAGHVVSDEPKCRI